MKKLLSLFLAAVLLLGVGGAGALAADTEELVGTYTLTDMETDGSIDTDAMLDLMSSMGLHATLEIRKDGSAVMDLFGTTMELQFDFTEKTVTSEGEAVPYTYEDGVLEIRNQDTSMTFTKGEAQDVYRQLCFDYYVAEALVEDGEKTEPEEDDELIVLRLFSDDSALLSIGEDEMLLRFDFEENTVTMADGDGEKLPFTLEDEQLRFGPDEENYISFRLSDPGWAGPYALCDFVSESTENLGEEGMAVLSTMGMLFKLSIDEDGKGVIDIFGTTSVMYFDFDKMLVSDEDGEDAIPFTYENGVLTITKDGEYMSFKRILGEEEEAEAETEEASAPSPSAAKRPGAKK